MMIFSHLPPFHSQLSLKIKMIYPQFIRIQRVNHIKLLILIPHLLHSLKISQNIFIKGHINKRNPLQPSQIQSVLYV